MKRVRVTIEGESYITLEGVAQCYECEVTWLREVYSLGLLGRGQIVEETFVIQTRMLDRVAEVIRMTRHQGIDLAVVAAILELD